MGPIASCLYSIHLIDDLTFELSMRQRSNLFLLELHKYQQQQDEIISLTFQTSVIQIIDGKTRLAAAVTFLVDSKLSTVNYVLLETVDEGSVAEQRLYPRQGGPGSISAAAEEKVLEHLIAYIGRLHECGNVSVLRLTYGRGLMHVGMVGRSFGRQIRVTVLVSNEKIPYINKDRELRLLLAASPK